nr:probable ATP-dependent RNA helicase DDX5 [Dermacentor andersoni]
MAYSGKPGLPKMFLSIVPYSTRFGTPNCAPRNGPHEGVRAPTWLSADPARDLGCRKLTSLKKADVKAILAIRYGEYNRSRSSEADHSLRMPDWTSVHSPTYKKDFYREHFRTALRSTEEVEAYRKANDIIVTGRGVPKPILHMDEAGFPERVTKIVDARQPGSSPTALQAQCWPVALSGRDLVAVDCAASEGKLLAYLVPAIIHIQHQPAMQHGVGPIVLVVTATRETAQQVQIVARELIDETGIRTTCLVSGDPKRQQLNELEKGAEVCIATVGRLVAFMEECKVDLRRCMYLVLDEVDRMLAMGFDEALRTIAGNVRPDCQTLVWLASRTRKADQLIETLSKDWVTVSVGMATQDDQNQRVEHVVLICEKAEKKDKLIALFTDVLRDESDRVIVFVETKQTVEDLVSSVRFLGWAAVGVHGRKTERERDLALNTFRFGKVPILVATDVTGRALDAANVRFVVSYEYPINPEEYRRRFKHAARPDGTGRAYTFVQPDNSARARELVWFLREAKHEIPADLRKVANEVARK